MDPLLGGSIAQSAGNIIGGFMDQKFQERNLRLQEAANTRLTDYNYGKNLEMWHLQNLYNSPKSQMQRFSEAGLNPNLVYGRGTPGNAAAQVKREKVTKGLAKANIPMPDMLGMYNNFRTSQVNADYVEQKTITEGLNSAIRNIDKKIAEDFKWYNAFTGKQYKVGQLRLQSEDYQLQIKRNQLINAQIQNALLNANIQAQTIKYNPWKFGGSMAKSVGGLFNPLARGAKGFKAAKAFKR